MRRWQTFSLFALSELVCTKNVFYPILLFPLLSHPKLLPLWSVPDRQTNLNTPFTLTSFFCPLSARGPTRRRNSTGLAELWGGWPIEQDFKTFGSTQHNRYEFTGRNTFGTCFGETGLKIRPDVFRHDDCEQKKHVLLCKMSPTSYFFLFEKAKKIIWNLFTVVVKKHFRQTFCPASRSRCIFKNSDSCRHKVCDFMRSHAIACDLMRSHAISCDRMRSLSNSILPEKGIIRDRMRSHAISCDRMRSHAIAAIANLKKLY